ncbi:ankyrin repeat-containing domain protein [Xylariales sp. PMI_506]|nr:ankyrin repeat-containing domain protein [Xylariales sp. PMI_506]
MRQGSHRTTTTIAAAAATTTTSSLSFDHYGHQNYDVESAPALTFSSTQADDISIPVTSPASNGAAATASAVDVAEEAAAWNHLMDSHMMDTAGGESCDRARREPSSMSPADSTVQYRHEHYSPTPPSTMLARHRNRSTSLHIAASQGDSEMVKLLLNRGANAGLLNEDGQTPLHLAVIALAKAAKRLSGGCSSNVDDDSGGGGGSGQAKEAEKTLQLLLGARSAGADPRALDNSGRSVLFTAVATGSEGAVQMVLDSMGCESSLAGSSSSSSRSSSSSSSGANKGIGADVGRAGIQAALDEPDAQGTLPLHLAVASRSASMVLLLLSNGADIDG